MSRRSQLALFHVLPPSSDRHREPCASDVSRVVAPHGCTPSAPVWMSAYMRLGSDGAIATSVLPYGDFGNPGSAILVNVFPPSCEMWMPLPGPPLSSTCVCRYICHVPASTTFGSFCEICRPEQPVFSSTKSTCSQVLPPSSVRNTPRSRCGPVARPSAQTRTMFSLVGCTTIVPMRPVSASPIFVHVSPASVDL